MDKSNVFLVRINSHCTGEVVVHVQQKSLWLYPYFYPCPIVQCCNWREVEIKECSFSFTIKCTCLMGTSKKTEYNSICKVFTEVFFNRQNSTFHSSNSFSSKGKSNLVTVVVGSLTSWTGVVTIIWPAQAKFYAQHREFQHLFNTDHPRPYIVPLSPRVPVAFVPVAVAASYSCQCTFFLQAGYKL